MKHAAAFIAALTMGLALAAPAAKADLASGTFRIGLTVVLLSPPVARLRNAIYTPGAAASNVALAGFSHIRLMRRDEAHYLFSGVSAQDGRRYLITVAAWRGLVENIVRG